MTKEKNDKTALEFLKEHWDEIAFVELTFTWSSYVMTDLEGWHAEEDGEVYPSVAAKFFVVTLDEEYSFSGTSEEAIGFFESYDIWDCRLDSSDIKDGILFKEYNSDVEEYKEPGEYDVSDLYLEIKPLGLVCYKHGYWAHSSGSSNLKFVRDDPEGEEEDDE